LRALLFGALALACDAGAASFDCKKARSEEERAICANPELSKLDDEMGAAYRKLWDGAIKYEDAKAQAAFRANQKRWIEWRARCGATVACLRDAYRDRIAWLAHPLQRYTGRYENAEYCLYLTIDRDLVPTLRMFRGAKGEDLERIARQMGRDLPRTPARFRGPGQAHACLQSGLRHCREAARDHRPEGADVQLHRPSALSLYNAPCFPRYPVSVFQVTSIA